MRAGNVYWTTYGDGTVRTCPASGCGGAPTTLASVQNSLASLAVDATNVYWVNYQTGTVMKCGVGGCGGSPTTLWLGPAGLTAIAADGTNVYFTTGTQVMRCAIGGCNDDPTTLANESDGTAIPGGYFRCGSGGGRDERLLDQRARPTAET